jgi:hypothetical protein
MQAQYLQIFLLSLVVVALVGLLVAVVVVLAVIGHQTVRLVVRQQQVKAL